MGRLKFSLASAVGLLIIIHIIPAAEIDQFTDRELYQDCLADFTPIINEYTNKILEQAVLNCNIELETGEYTDTESKRIAAREIYKLTSGDSLIEIDQSLSPILSSLFIVRKFVKGPLQTWIESDENKDYWYQPENNYYSSLYPSIFNMNKSYVIKVANEFIGADKIDHFFDQGYGYYTESDYGKSDEAAVDYGIKTEYGIYGLHSGGVFSFADLRANWGGYQFYKNLFIGNPSLLSIDKKGKVIINHSFDWADYIDTYYDELKNPSFCSNLIAKLIRRHINNNYFQYLTTYNSLHQRGVINEGPNDRSFYLNKNIDYDLFNYLDPQNIFNNPPTAVILSGDGLKEAYQIGAWKGLIDIDINIDAVYEASAETTNSLQFYRNDKLYSNSASSNSSAIKLAEADNYHKVILVSLNPITSAGDLFDKLFDYLNYKIDIIQISHSSPVKQFSGFSPENTSYLMQLGYLDCLRTFDILEGKKYYIYNDDSIRKMYLNLTLEERLESIELLRDKTFSSPLVSEDNSYDEIISPKLLSTFRSEISMLEHYASKFQIKKLEIYSMTELQELISIKYIKRDRDIFNTNNNLDFLSYLYYKTKYRYHPESVINDKFLKSFSSY